MLPFYRHHVMSAIKKPLIHHGTFLVSSLCPFIRSFRWPREMTKSQSARLSTSKDMGYKSIGSFHSDSVEELISLPDHAYPVPCLPFEYEPFFNLQSFSDNFYVSGDEWTFVNHGAFGAALKCGHLLASKWRDYSETQPLRYFDRDLLPHLIYSTRQLANFCHGHRSAMTLSTWVFIPFNCAVSMAHFTIAGFFYAAQNSTHALNTVISGYTRLYAEHAKVIYFDTTYGSVKKMAKHYTNSLGTFHEIPLITDILAAFPNHHADHQCSSNLLLNLVENKLKELKDHQGLTLANALLILDHTTSNTAINFPIEKIASVAKKEGMLVGVDGAHGLLAQDLNLSRLSEAGIDFYISNCHKWFCSPRGAAFLYCEDATLRETILRRPAVISHGIDDGYHSRFIWDGCRDYAAQLTLPILIQFWQQLGPNRIRSIMRSNLTNAVRLLVHKWYSETSFDPDLTNMTSTGVMIVPFALHSPMVR